MRIHARTHTRTHTHTHTRTFIQPAGALQEMSELADLLADMRDRLEDLIVEMEAVSRVVTHTMCTCIAPRPSTSYLCVPLTYRMCVTIQPPFRLSQHHNVFIALHCVNVVLH